MANRSSRSARVSAEPAAKFSRALGLPRMAIAVAAGIVLAVPWIAPRFWPLEWLGMVAVLWLALEASSVREASRDVFVAGGSGILVAFYWLVETIHVFGRYPIPVSLVLFLLLALYMGAQWALFGALTRWVGAGPLAMAPAVVWIGLEFVSSNVFPYRRGAISS